MGLVFIYPALPTCLVVYVQKSDFHLVNVFSSDVVETVTSETETWLKFGDETETLS